MAGELELVGLVSSFESTASVSDVAKRCIGFLGKSTDRSQAHSRLCSAMIRRADGGNADMSQLLRFSGDAQVLVVVYSHMAHAKLATAKWLASEVLKIMQAGGLSDILLSSSEDPASSRLSILQEHLVGVVCRLPDVLANRLGRSLKEELLPKSYFRCLGEGVLTCLKDIREDRKGSGCGYSLLFPAAVLGTAATLGQQAAVMAPLLPALEDRVTSDQTWRELSQELFSRLPSTSLEPVLETLVNHVSPSLLPSSTLNALIGRDILTNHRAKFILSHKLILVRVPPSPAALHNLLGFLGGDTTGQGLLRKALHSALEVWSDVTSVRHMDRRQHEWISRVIVLGVTLLLGHQEEFKEVKSDFLKLVMLGVQTHIQSPLPEVRHIGMAMGEVLMNSLQGTTSAATTADPDSEHRKLEFEYPVSEATEAIKKLGRPVVEQERELEEGRRAVEGGRKVQGAEGCGEEAMVRKGAEGSGGAAGAKGGRKEKIGQFEDSSEEEEDRFGEGYVHAVDCSDADSDDDLIPYAMDDDPDASEVAAPRYLRTLMQDLLSNNEPQKVEVAVRSAESLIRSQPSDLKEVCVELAKILLHLEDNCGIEDFSSRRHKAMVALTVLCPLSATPYLTQEFYAPNYSLRHRLEILEVLSASALELSSPTLPSSSPSAPAPTYPSHWTTRKPWEDIISQRLQAKTRTISKGPSRPAPTAIPNRFQDVVPLFFFPLMNRFDQRMNTLDLLGEDSLVLGNLLYTLGTVMHAACNLPLVSTMAVPFLDFLWVMRYHPDAYVRQGALYGLGMLIWATPTHVLLGELSTGLAEGVAWMKEVLTEDADAQCRTLARYALTLLSSTMDSS